MYKRILIAEDDPKDVELTLEALTDHNLANEVRVVRDGAEVLDYLHRRGAFAAEPEGNPLLLLLDLKMPKLDGIEVLKQIKADKNLKSIPVVILTASRQAKDLRACHDLGANAYVVKPVKFPEFLNVIKQVGISCALINEQATGSTAKPR